MLSEYTAVILFLGFGLLLGAALLVVGHLISKQNPNPGKNAAYECGFDAFGPARMPFDVRFYLVAILFIIFDLETAFLFPFALAFRDLATFGLIAMAIFLGLLTLGFLYEWAQGALEWE